MKNNTASKRLGVFKKISKTAPRQRVYHSENLKTRHYRWKKVVTLAEKLFSDTGVELTIFAAFPNPKASPTYQLKVVGPEAERLTTKTEEGLKFANAFLKLSPKSVTPGSGVNTNENGTNQANTPESSGPESNISDSSSDGSDNTQHVEESESNTLDIRRDEPENNIQEVVEPESNVSGNRRDEPDINTQHVEEPESNTSGNGTDQPNPIQHVNNNSRNASEPDDLQHLGSQETSLLNVRTGSTSILPENVGKAVQGSKAPTAGNKGKTKRAVRSSNKPPSSKKAKSSGRELTSSPEQSPASGSASTQKDGQNADPTGQASNPVATNSSIGVSEFGSRSFSHYDDSGNEIMVTVDGIPVEWSDQQFVEWIVNGGVQLS